MSYLNDFKEQIRRRNFQSFFKLWEEYCTNDAVDPEEFIELLTEIKESEFANLFSQFVESALPVWSTIEDPKLSYKALSLLIDMETSNSPELAELCLNTLKKHYANDPLFSQRIRIVGLRRGSNFQGALSNYALLSHMKVGNCVYQKGGWGVGEIMECSNLREQVAIEFEHVLGLQHFTFTNAFKSLVPLESEHFLARRFVDPDGLEEQAKKDPLSVIHLLLHSLGPKTATEMKGELCELVIPEKDWTSWWQSVRPKLKKDPLISPPVSSRGPFSMRKQAVSQEDQLAQALKKCSTPSDFIKTAYRFIRDLPALLKKEEVVLSIREKLQEFLRSGVCSPSETLQIHLFFDTILSDPQEELLSLIEQMEDPKEAVESLQLATFKRRALELIREKRSDWTEVFIALFRSLQSGSLQSYLLAELKGSQELEECLRRLETHPTEQPELLVWYFQQLLADEKKTLPFSDDEGLSLFFEAFLILLHKIEQASHLRTLFKKMLKLLLKGRFALIRKMFAIASLSFVQEYLLLFAKCHEFNEEDRQTFQSLAKVAHPSISTHKKETKSLTDGHIIWTTEEGYLKMQERIHQIGTVEMVASAKEVGAARALGDLRENAEYKFALEKQSRLQSELKTLSSQLNRTRVITKEDIPSEEVGVGSIVEIEGKDGKRVEYTILGPWDADPDKKIISFQSELAQALLGEKKGGRVTFRDETYTITGLFSYLG